MKTLLVLTLFSVLFVACNESPVEKTFDKPILSGIDADRSNYQIIYNSNDSIITKYGFTDMQEIGDGNLTLYEKQSIVFQVRIDNIIFYLKTK